MALIVQKLGGTSVGTSTKMIEAARQIRTAWANGHDIVVVVSAMGGVTDELLDLAAAVSDRPDARELDALLCTGESASAALLSIALNDLGVDSRSLTGAEAGIRTDHRHGEATVEQVDPRVLQKDLRRRVVPVVAGFQGEAGSGGPRTTLGRGGSDTTGVVLAAALDAEYCEIVTDVAGIYTADPQSIAGARRHTALLYEEVSELATSGAEVLCADSVECARAHAVDLKIRSWHSDSDPGTWVGGRRRVMGDRHGDSWTPADDVGAVAGVAVSTGLARCVLRSVTAEQTVGMLRALAEHGIVVELRRFGNLGTEDASDVSITLPASGTDAARELLAGAEHAVPADDVHWTPNLARLSVIGLGIGQQPNMPLRLLEALQAVGAARTDLVVTSNKLSVLTGESTLAEATQRVHDAFVPGSAPHRIGAARAPEVPADEGRSTELLAANGVLHGAPAPALLMAD